ncbi:translation initiation factor IF-2 [Candidatus Babela massiliensis]|uniref:Translation initiation factor IF-2 n=1 Tax=Candidatus Babela massiliensis TaxID=673862 RepID=V6DGK9_9BACT|nr:translation initiation factor IF-2 [Candidatus Babela massiliensis]CDK30689.1 Translation initiation factor 2 (IF-2; GTPase) [Candidatus Babela massiliensis]
MAIRVYELSKKLGLTSKELINILSSLGVEVSSHISVLPSDIVELIEEEVKNKISSKTKTDIESDTDQISDNSLNELHPNSTSSISKTLKDESADKISKHDNPQKVQSNPDKNSLVLEPVALSILAEKINKPVSEIILTLLKQGIVITKNQILPEKMVKKIADLYGINVISSSNAETKKINQKISNRISDKVSQEGTWQERNPIVVVIGHVDHGKTTLLDFIRKSRVAAKEKGGITQHLGAYEVKIPQGNMVFLDTPGHEAFSMLRVRGLKAADIAILVVAADDGVKPQTIEAINHAKSVGLPIIVAINKVDKVSPQQVDIVKQQLTKYDLIPEEWAGNTPFVAISAKLGTGIDELLEVIALQSQLMELKTNISVPARGYILESKLEKGRGPVATIISQHGTLYLGDYFFAGNTSGKINSIIDSYGKRLSQVGPSVPVQISGFSQQPNAGDIFRVITQQEYKKGPSNQQEFQSEVKAKSLYTESGINLIIKADNASSKEAILTSIDKLSSTLGQNFNIIYSGLSDVTESDVILAMDTKSYIYTFHVKTLPNAYNLINNNNVTVKHFDIIYNLLEDLEALSESLKPIQYISKKIGEGNVIKIFDIKSLGKVAGMHVRSGKFIREGKVVILRNNQKIGEGKIKSLQREKKSVKEVLTGFECALLVDGFEDWQIDDRIECYQEVPA